jgi:hypothetical protein
VKRLLVVLLCLVAGCPSGPSKRILPSQAAGGTNEDEATRLARLHAELLDDILTSYERDDPPELDTGMIDPRVGAVRIGVGPGDVYIAGDSARTANRWPLAVDPTGEDPRAAGKALPTPLFRVTPSVRSKRLEIRIAADRSAAWMSDELSRRIEVCGKTAVIPLRITALYARDGDRWVPVFEHLSFARPPTPALAPLPKPIKTEVVSGDLRDELSGILGRGLFRTPRDPLAVARDPSALVLGPDAGDEWHGAQVLGARLPAGRLEDRRVGLIGRDPAAATVAYWVGSYTADIPPAPGVAAGKVRMRVTHVFEKRPQGMRDREPSEAESCAPSRDKDRDKDRPKDRPKDNEASKDKTADCRWMLVQSHMSQPISDGELGRLVFGTALISVSPLAFDCAEGSPATAPAVVPRRGADPPAAQTP